MSQFTVYRSQDASAPVLTGASSSGALTTVLDAILVNGYGTQPAAGWSIVGTATYQRAYKMGAGTGFVLSVNDSSAGSGGAQEALIYGFETATSAITGTGQFPAQGSPNVLRKSATNDATPRAWVCFADNRTVYFFAASGDTASTYFGLMFGDFYSVCPGDQRNCMLIGSTTQNSGTNTTDTCTNAQIPTNAMTGHYIAQTYCGSNYGYITASKHGDAAKQGSTTNQLASNVTPLLTPNAGDGAYYVAPVWLCEAATGMVRGRLRGSGTCVIIALCFLMALLSRE